MEITKTSILKTRFDGKLRSRASRKRINENPKRNPVRCHRLYLHDSAVKAILDDAILDDEKLTDDMILALVLEFVAYNPQIIRQAVENKKRKINRNALRKR